MYVQCLSFALLPKTTYTSRASIGSLQVDVLSLVVDGCVVMDDCILLLEMSV